MKLFCTFPFSQEKNFPYARCWFKWKAIDIIRLLSVPSDSGNHLSLSLSLLPSLPFCKPQTEGIQNMQQILPFIWNFLFCFNMSSKQIAKAIKTTRTTATTIQKFEFSNENRLRCALKWIGACGRVKKGWQGGDWGHINLFNGEWKRNCIGKNKYGD